MLKLWQHQAKFTEDFHLLLNFIAVLGLIPVMAEVFRTIEQEIEYIKEGKSHLTDPNHCMHVLKCAGDLELFLPAGSLLIDEATWQKIGDYWESLDPLNRWGGNFPKWYPGSSFRDLPHMERHILGQIA